MQSLCKHARLTRQCDECREAAGCGHGTLRSDFCRICYDREEMKRRIALREQEQEQEQRQEPAPDVRVAFWAVLAWALVSTAAILMLASG